MVTADHDGRGDLALGHELVEEQPGLVALAVAQPADARGQALELHVLLRGVDPLVQVLVVREELLDRVVRDLDVLGVAGERHPAEGAEALAEQRADVRRDEARELEGAGVAGVAGLVADRVAVVEDLGALVLELDHRLDLRGHGLLGLLGEAHGIGLGLGIPLLHGELRGQVGQGIVRGGLVGHDVHGDLARAVAAQQLREHVRGVAHVAHGQRAVLVLGRHDLGEGGVQVRLHLVQVALGLAALEARLVHVDDEAGAAVQRHGERLGAAHAAAAAGDGQGAGQGGLGDAALLVHLAGDGVERLVGALQDALRGDVDPGPGGHLAVHHEALVLELAELGPRGPVAHQVGVGDQHARGPLVGAEDTHRFAGLDQQGLVVLELLEGLHDGVERLPAASRTAGAAVDHQVVRTLSDLRVQVVHEHAQGRFGLPALGADLGAAGCADGAGVGQCHEVPPGAGRSGAREAADGE